MIDSLILAAAMQQSQSHHVVVTGDTLSGIAAAAGVSLSAVEAANQQIANPDLIFTGQVVNLPGGHIHGHVNVHSGGGAAPVGGRSDHEPDGDADDVGQAPAQHQVQLAPVRHHHHQAPVTSSSSGSSGSSSSPGSIHIPGMPQSFANCIWFRESTNGTNPAAHGNQFGIIPASGHNVAGMSVAQQEQVAGQIFAQVGAAAWSPFDGCPAP
jgi:LysM repeat protein